MKLLAGRAHSVGEMRRKLRPKAASAEDLETAIGRLKEHGYLDDRRFAQSFAAARLENQGFGRNRVLRDLRQRQVAPAMAARTVEGLYANVDEEKLIEDLLRRKYRGAPREDLFQDEKSLAAAYRRLLHAGFSTGNVIRVLKRFAKDPDLLDRFEPPEEPSEEA
ncbi:MAG: recombination regulator RecX [Acidobacteria bacterium]|nr:recombination regulator RecX [Acidobacteriota bacterium]